MSALPEWPASPYDKAGFAPARDAFAYERGRVDAALAPLRACALYLDHTLDCDVTWANNWETTLRSCTCGLNELLADLLPGGE